MTCWQEEIQAAMTDFVTVAALAGKPLGPDDFQVEFLPAPHRPPSAFPRGKMAIYGFWGDGAWLKIGMAGAKSQARYTSQHYFLDSAPSTLAKSLARDARMVVLPDFDPSAPGAWIKTTCHRVNILLPATHGRPLLALLEAFLHARLSPRHER
jgi:hypothetical protein